MLESIRSTQQIADKFKSIVLDADDTDKHIRMDVLRTVARFEQFGWHPRVMEQAIKEAAPDIQVTSDGVTYDGTPADALDKINSVLSRYIELYGYDEVARQKLYTMQTAAAYLGISRSMMETYVIRRGEIEGEKIGRAWVFTQQTLDEFKQRKRPRGRPPAGSDT